MPLDIHPLQFPWELFMQAQQAKNKNQQDMNANILGIGTSLGDIGKNYEQQKAKSTVAQALEAMRTGRVPTQMEQAGGGIPSGPMQNFTPQQPSISTPSQPPQMPPELMNALMTLNPEQGTKTLYDTLEPKTQWKTIPNMLSKSGKPLQENSRTGEVREAPYDVTPTGRGNAAFGVGATTWDNSTPEEKQLGQALYEGRMRPSDLGYRDRSIAVKLAEQWGRRNGLPPYKSYAGNVAGKTAEAFATGKPGMNALALNTALGHVDSVYDAFQEIGNTDQAWLNQPINYLKKQTNDPNVVKLDVSLNALRGELGTVFKGSAGTDQDAKHWMDFLSDNLTPAQFNAAIPQIDELLRSRLSALEYQRSSGMGGRGEGSLLSPKGAAISNKLGKGKGSKNNLTRPDEEAAYQAYKKAHAGGR